MHRHMHIYRLYIYIYIQRTAAKLYFFVYKTWLFFVYLNTDHYSSREDYSSHQRDACYINFVLFINLSFCFDMLVTSMIFKLKGCMQYLLERFDRFDIGFEWYTNNYYEHEGQCMCVCAQRLDSLHIQWTLLSHQATMWKQLLPNDVLNS